MDPKTELQDLEYLGDGVYAGHDGYNTVLWLDTEGLYGKNAIALDPSVISALLKYSAKHGLTSLLNTL